ncbi:MAG: hypothetical protein JZU53_04310 [Paludibacter sp.]|jgi:hypothetical protein|nr:hypothetical protein [Paludibacter sp.]
MGTNLLGGWSAYSTTISSEAKKAFDEAFKGFVGVGYKPLAVSQQVVSGMNYRFFCNAKGVYPGAVDYAALVEIYDPLQHPAHITSIKKVD